MISSKYFKFERKLHFAKNGRPKKLQNEQYFRLMIFLLNTIHKSQI